MIKQPSLGQMYFCVGLAFIFWAIIFGFKLVNFWLGLSLATVTLAGFGLYFGGLKLHLREVTLKNTALGFLSALILYFIFAVGRLCSLYLFTFAGLQIQTIYTLRLEAAPSLIALILFFLTSPAEEIFWRGFLQGSLSKYYGKYRGWLLAAIIYGSVHLVSGNFILSGAALVAGLFWGFVYLYTSSLYVCILSHALWTVAIFLIWPLN